MGFRRQLAVSLFLFMSIEAMASRTVYVPRFTLRTYTYQPGVEWFPPGIAGASCSVAVSFMNLSAINQNVVLTFETPGGGFGINVPKAGGGASNWPTAPIGVGGWYSKTFNSSDVVRSFQILPNKNYNAKYAVHCEAKKNGTNACTMDATSFASTSEFVGNAWAGGIATCAATDAVCGADISLNLGLTIVVSEDRGALIASVNTNCNIDNATHLVQSEEVPMINGGRPF